MDSAGAIIVVGAGIGGLTAALALAQHGFRVTVLEASTALEEAGAGIQLSPNATHVLRALGLCDRLTSCIVAPRSVRIRSGSSGRDIGQVDLGAAAVARYGAPYWSIHRADLQRTLLEAVTGSPNITVRLGIRVSEVRVDASGVVVAGTAGLVRTQERGAVVIGADGVWSAVRTSLGHTVKPQFRQRTAWRALLPAEAVPAEARVPRVNLWLGADAHLVHYPVCAGHAINVVAIVTDKVERPGWSDASPRLPASPFSRWPHEVRRLLEATDQWQAWSLFDLPPLEAWGTGAATLLGDAAHAALPFLAQGGAMAIEDAWVLASELAHTPNDLTSALRRYEAARIGRTTKAAREAVRAGQIYHLGGPLGFARDMVMRGLGTSRLQSRNDWLYDWKPA